MRAYVRDIMVCGLISYGSVSEREMVSCVRVLTGAERVSTGSQVHCRYRRSEPEPAGKYIYSDDQGSAMLVEEGGGGIHFVKPVDTRALE
jgi:hypothetical protein